MLFVSFHICGSIKDSNLQRAHRKLTDLDYQICGCWRDWQFGDDL